MVTTESDIDLVALAAKAIGLHSDKSFVAEDQQGVYFCVPPPDDYPLRSPVIWRPLDDDGDAFRLQTALDLSIERKNCKIICRKHMVLASIQLSFCNNIAASQKNNATRRVIVLAAAQIGKQP